MYMVGRYALQLAKGDLALNCREWLPNMYGAEGGARARSRQDLPSAPKHLILEGLVFEGNQLEVKPNKISSGRHAVSAARPHRMKSRAFCVLL